MSISFAVITISDRSYQGLRQDKSGPLLKNLIDSQGWISKYIKVIPDDLETIKATLELFSKTYKVDVILTTGGHRFSPRDITPEATLSVIEKQVPGISEAIRYESMKITPHAMLSRAVSGILQDTLIINFPGNPKAIEETFEIIVPILPHAVELIHEDPSAEDSHKFSG